MVFNHSKTTKTAKSLLCPCNIIASPSNCTVDTLHENSNLRPKDLNLRPWLNQGLKFETLGFKFETLHGLTKP